MRNIQIMWGEVVILCFLYIGCCDISGHNKLNPLTGLVEAQHHFKCHSFARIRNDICNASHVLYNFKHYTHTRARARARVPATAVLEVLSFSHCSINPEKKQDSGIQIQTRFSRPSVVYLPDVLTEWLPPHFQIFYIYIFIYIPNALDSTV